MTKFITTILSCCLLLLSCSKDVGLTEAHLKKFIKFYGSVHSDEAQDLLVNEDATFFLLGTYTDDQNQSDIYLFKVNKYGHEIWRKAFDYGTNETAKRIKKDQDGNLIICGNSSGNESNDILIIKTDSEGNEKYSKIINLKQTILDSDTIFSDEEATDIEISTDNEIIIVGSTNKDAPTDNPEELNILLMKLDSSGEIVYANSWGKNSEDETSEAVTISDDGDCFVVGSASSFASPDLTGNQNILLLKINTNGNVVDSQTYGTSLDDSGQDICICSDGNLVILGNRENSQSQKSVYLTKININDLRDTFWQYPTLATSNTSNSVSGARLRQTPNGQLAIAGQTTDFISTSMYLMILDENGNLLKTYTYGSNENETSAAVSFSSDNKLFLLGTSSVNNTSMIAFLKQELLSLQ